MEVIPSVHTSQAVIQKTVDLMKDIGKVPIVEKKELNGFVLNRLQYAIVMEAWRLVEVCVHVRIRNYESFLASQLVNYHYSYVVYIFPI